MAWDACLVAMPLPIPARYRPPGLGVIAKHSMQLPPGLLVNSRVLRRRPCWAAAISL